MLELDATLALGDLALELELQVERGETLTLAGPSGAGKTSVLRMVAGLLRPDRGRIVCDGSVWTDTENGVTLLPEQRLCGYVFQEYALFPRLRAWENVAYGLRGLSRRRRRERARELLERFGVGSLAEARPGTLSGGERQRVALARALARKPAVLLLDEPLSALDAHTRAHAARELGDVLRGAGVPTLLVTHDFLEAALLGDEVAVLEAGTLAQRGSAADLSARPGSAFVADFVGASVLSGVARRGPAGLTLVDLDGGGTLWSTDSAQGRVAASVFPWEVALEGAGAERHGSAQNRLDARVVSVTQIANRVRIGLSTPQALTSEVTETGLRSLALAPGARVTASWKATATRLTPL
jgi:molybdate transport system ATP-binding protein